MLQAVSSEITSFLVSRNVGLFGQQRKILSGYVDPCSDEEKSKVTLTAY